MTNRWVDLSRKEAERWSARSAFAAERLGPVSGVADYGCGWMTLERYLAPGVRYVPIDLVGRDARTLVCHFEDDALPETDVPAAAVLGVLGYLRRPDRFMRALAERHARAVVSYKSTDAPDPEPDRRAAGLINDFSKQDLSALFIEAGYTIDRIDDFKRIDDRGSRQTVWTLVR